MGNTTCPIERAAVDPVPFYSDGNLNFKAHTVGWIVCGFFTLIATGASSWLVWKHLTYYTCPQQQRHIVRMLFMVPIYAIISTLSYIFFNESIYYTTICDCYEAVVITSFFNLIVQYVGDTPAEQIEVFRQVKLKKWFFPLGFWKYRPNGVHFLWLMKICILQYAILQPICTLVAVGLQYYGLYCLESWEPYFGHVWLSLIVAISITIAMYCIIQIYLPIRKELEPYKPVLKFLAIKAIVFLTFWQNSFLSVLIYFNFIKQTKYFTTADIQVGINALLITFEMMIFGFVHIKAFTYIIYRPQDRSRTTKRGRALLDVVDFRDWWYDIKNTSRYVAARGRGKDFTIADDIRSQKHQHLVKALGRDRLAHLEAERKLAKGQMPTFWKSEAGDVVSESLINAADVEKVGEINGGDCSRQVCTVRADDYREKEDEGLAKANLKGMDSKLNTESEPMLPHLPYDFLTSIPSSRLRDAHPELSRFHHLDNELNNDVEIQDIEDILIPRKGGRSRKEASLGLGTWWRSFRERVSGGDTGETGETVPEDDAYDEKTNMLAEELSRGMTTLLTSKKEDGGHIDGKDELLFPPILQRNNVDSPSVSDSVLRGRDSPLSLLINEHCKQGEDKQRRTNSPKISLPMRERQVAVVSESQRMARQGSKKAAMDIKEESDQEAGRVETFCQRIQDVTIQGFVVESVEPSISSGTTSSILAPSAPNHTNGLQHGLQRKQIRSSSIGIRDTGIKGKKIALILPKPLSNAPLPNPAVEPQPEIYPPSRLCSGHHAIPSTLAKTASSLPTTKISFVENTKVQVHPQDDPEAEPINRAGTVVAGAQSLSQINAMRKQREEQERKRQSQMKFSTTNQLALPPSQSKSILINEKQRQSEPRIALPAPSQLAQMQYQNDPFAAAKNAQMSSTLRVSSAAMLDEMQTRHGSRMALAQERRHSTTVGRASNGPSLQVGSVLSRQDVLNITAPPPLSHYPQHHQNQHEQRYPRNSLLSSPAAVPLPWQQQRPPPQPNRSLRHSTGNTRNSAPIVASYDPYSGEPSWIQDGQTQSQVESRRRRYEAPPGFHFDYID